MSTNSTGSGRAFEEPPAKRSRTYIYSRDNVIQMLGLATDDEIGEVICDGSDDEFEYRDSDLSASDSE